MISTKVGYSAVFKTEHTDDAHKFLHLPQPSGSYPYRLIYHNDSEKQPNKMTFHMVGDTGGLNTAGFQNNIAAQMTQQYLCPATEQEKPSFLYHLGDIVYHFGEAEQYNAQFLKPFDFYPGPIYAIAGNHDTDVNPESEQHYDSLEAFYNTFCNTCSKTIYFGEENKRKSQVQPHVYWTMETPLATIIGLHTNVPKYGCITSEQKNWFIKELQNASENHAGKALIVCMHHAPYSADVNHGSSAAMIRFLELSFAESRVKPDAVFSGHVHNYQRYNKHYADGKIIPYIVAGAGGFDELHQLADSDETGYTTESELLDNVQLKSYCDDQHGFLKIEIEKTPFNFTITGMYYTISQQDGCKDATLFDKFIIDLTGK